MPAAARCCLLQERLDAAALAFKAERAKMAEEEIIAMEVGTAPRCVLVYFCKPFIRLHRYPGLGLSSLDDRYIAVE